MVEVSSTNPLKAYALMQGATSAEPVRIAKLQTAVLHGSPPT